jgi:hypothetical protein
MSSSLLGCWAGCSEDPDGRGNEGGAEGQVLGKGETNLEGFVGFRQGKGSMLRQMRQISGLPLRVAFLYHEKVAWPALIFGPTFVSYELEAPSS